MDLEMLPARVLTFDIIKLKLPVDYLHKMINCPKSRLDSHKENSNFQSIIPKNKGLCIIDV